MNNDLARKVPVLLLPMLHVFMIVYRQWPRILDKGQLWVCCVMSVGRTTSLKFYTEIRCDDSTLHVFLPHSVHGLKNTHLNASHRNSNMIYDIREYIYTNTQAVNISCAIE